MKVSEIINYYSRREIKEEIFRIVKQREVVPYYGTNFGSRPQAINYINEIDEFVLSGATSFHISEERWSNPLLLKQEMSKKDLDKIRVGWDLLIDIDSNFLEYSKICASLIIEALQFHGVSSCVSIKFSGRAGFHILIPYESFPNKINNRPITILFPDAARTIINYLKAMIKNHLANEILQLDSMKKISEKTNKKYEELTEINEEGMVFNPFKVVDIDSNLISSRHLFRSPFSLNEKVWLVSLPIEKSHVLDFNIKEAEPDKVSVNVGFLETENLKGNEAKQLFIQAFDWEARTRNEILKEFGERIKLPEKAIPSQFFPPCIKSILRGLSDGRKRSVFILINFLRNMGWSFENIEKEIMEWNQRNTEPLREGYIKTQLKWHSRLKDVYLPPNCDNQNYYKDIGVCVKDNLCEKVKNPVVYSLKKARYKK
jgi:DNA primase catalytic subunit